MDRANLKKLTKVAGMASSWGRDHQETPRFLEARKTPEERAANYCHLVDKKMQRLDPFSHQAQVPPRFLLLWQMAMQPLSEDIK